MALDDGIVWNFCQIIMFDERSCSLKWGNERNPYRVLQVSHETAPAFAHKFRRYLYLTPSPSPNIGEGKNLITIGFRGEVYRIFNKFVNKCGGGRRG